MNNIPVSRYHFYKKQPVSVDIELNATFKDDYAGGAKNNITISNDIEDTLYLFDTEVPFVDNPFNKLDEMYLQLYINTVSSSTSHNPTFLLYPVKDAYNITEGTSTPLDKGLSVFSSVLSYENPLMIEQFDGENKGFGNDETKFFQFRRVRMEQDKSFFISFGDLVKFYDKKDEYINPNYYIDGVPIELVATVQNQYTGFPGYLKVKNFERFSNELRAKKGEWIEAGAYEATTRASVVGESAVKRGGGDLDKILGADTYVNSVTPYNSIFNNVHKEHNVYDIKVQTLESVGEDEFTFTMNNFDLTRDDVNEENTSARMHLFWENYSGSFSGGNVKDFANCYGNQSNVGVPQTMYGAITDIPVARKLDLLSSGTGSACMPEIEVVFKVKQIGTALNTSVGPSLGRSINFIFANKAPDSEESLWEYVARLYNTRSPGGSSPTDSNFALATGISRGATASGSFSLVDWASAGSEGVSSATGLPFIASPSLTTPGIDLPYNEWIRMRVRQYDNDKSILLYFPDLPTNSNGAIPNIVLDDQYIDGKFGGINTFCIAISNFRGVSVGGGGTTSHINFGYTADDDGGVNDREVEMLIDSISFHGYNHNIENITQGKLTTRKTRYPLTINSSNSVVTNPTSEWSTSGAEGDRASKTTNDNFYTQFKTPSPTIVSFGFDAKTELANSFLQFNNYRSALGAASSSLNDAFLKWGYSKNNVSAGGVTTGCINLTQGADILTDTEALFVDNFRQKGFIKVSGTSAINTAISSDWVKTVNPWVSALILEISKDGKTIVVDNPEIFDEPVGLPTSGGQAYVAFRQNNTATESDSGLFNTYTKMNAGSGSVGQKSDDLYQIKPRDGNTIFLNRSIIDDDIVETKIGTTTYTSKQPGISRALISPKKFWLWGMIQNVLPQANDTRTWGEWYDNPTYSGSLASPKIYDTIRGFSNTGTVGSTYNEFLYNDGSNQNIWQLDNLNTDSILEMNKDYGFGAYKEPSGEDPAVLGGYISKEMILTPAANVYFNMNEYAEKSKLSPTNKLKFAIYPELNNAIYYNINFDSAEGSTASRVPTVIYGYNKPLPTIDNLTVSPRFDFLKENVNVDSFGKSNGTDIVFNWQESKDIDYRLLFVDTIFIRTKYHRSRFIAQLNESGSTAKYYLGYNALAQGVSFNLTGTNTPDIEGAQGYASKFAGSTQLTQLTNTLRIGADNFTIMATLNPTDKASDSNLDVALEMSKTTTTDSNFALGVDNSNKIQFKVTGSTKLTSTTAYGMNGNEQLSVVITYDKSLDTDNLKMYVNGTLEDTADYTTSFETSGRIYIGGDISNSNHYSGFIEEISTHSETAYVVPNSRQFILSTKTLPDLSSGESNKYQARMFAFDRVNIRGETKNDVATSNSVSWKVTGVA